MRARLTTVLATATAVVGIALAAPAVQAQEDPAFDALVFSKTAAFRHDSIPAGVAAIEALGAEHGFTVTATEDAAAFTDQNLGQYEVVIWLSTTGDVLNDAQQAAFERYIQGGGGYVGIHAASDTEYDWAWYGGLVGAYFLDHPFGPNQFQDATVKVAGKGAPSNAELPNRWIREEEWYNFRSNPRDAVRVLATVDEKTYISNGYTGSSGMGEDHPISWCQSYDGGRAWYTAMGHKSEYFSEPLLLSHILGGIQMAAGETTFPCD
jgi:type 1 glutamine amidotransferase